MAKIETLADLKAERKRQYESLKGRKRLAYTIARRMGFSAEEARILSHKSLKLIEKLGLERCMQEEAKAKAKQRAPVA